MDEESIAAAAVTSVWPAQIWSGPSSKAAPTLYDWPTKDVSSNICAANCTVIRLFAASLSASRDPEIKQGLYRIRHYVKYILYTVYGAERLTMVQLLVLQTQPSD